MVNRKWWLILVFTALPLSGQIQFGGTVNPAGLYRLTNAKEISLPFRIATFSASYTWREFEFVTVSALEYRWRTNFSRAELREAYLVWYPSFGEVSLGKQIFAWGMADANNPTDNLSAYDYYYLFDNGTERKIGSLSASVKWYLGNWQLEGVFIPFHEPDRLVYEEDFPIQPPLHPDASQIDEVNDEREYGARVQTSFGNNDLAVSYFHGHDRLFSATMYLTDPPPTPYRFGYRKTDVYGLDMVNFLGDFTFRNEAAYFVTRQDRPEGFITFFGANYVELSAEYIQYVSQMEYSGFENFNVTAQLIGNHTFSVRSNIASFEQSFVAGMGTPFAGFLDKALLVSLSSTLWDNRLELKPMLLANLNEKGYMAGFELDYSPVESINLEMSVNQFLGDKALGNDYVFNQLEDFSNFRLGLKYSF